MFNNTHGRFTIALVTGTPGSGKSFCCSRDIYNVLCSSDRSVVTNVPLNVDKMVEWVQKKREDLTEEQIRERIVMLDAERLTRWQAEDGGPWELAAEGLAKGVMLGEGEDAKPSGADFILDECHLYCPSTGDGTSENVRVQRKRWKDWLGEVRHEGWRRVLFVSQDDTKIGKPIQQHAELAYELTNGATDRDPWFKIPLQDWYSLLASFTGIYTPVVIVAEYRRENRRSVCVHKERHRLFPIYFELYHSFAEAGGGAKTGEIERPKLEHEVRPALWWGKVGHAIKAPVWAWFANKYKGRLAICITVVCVGLWFCFGGGGKLAIGKFMDVVNKVSANMSTGGIADAKPKIPGPPGSSDVGRSSSSPASKNDGKNVNQTEDAEIDANSKIDEQFPAEFASAMSSIPPAQKAVVERAFREASSRMRAQAKEVERLKIANTDLEMQAAEPALLEAMPKVTGFIGNDKAFIDGRVMRAGEVLLFNEGKNRVKIRKIDPVDRVVYLEDARVIRFAVRDSDLRVPELASQPLHTSATASGGNLSTPLQPVGGAADASLQPSIPRNEKSILVPRSDGSGRVLPVDK